MASEHDDPEAPEDFPEELSAPDSASYQADEAELERDVEELEGLWDEEDDENGVSADEEIEELDELVEFEELDEEPELDAAFQEALDSQAALDTAAAEKRRSSRGFALTIAASVGLVWGAFALVKLGTSGPGLHVAPDAVEQEPQAAPPQADPSEVPPPEPPPPEEEVEPEEPPSWTGQDWAKNLEAPPEVRYTIKRGGSAKVVANLYKIFHHEMIEMNPGVDLDKELPPNTELVVYRTKSGQALEAESVGSPVAGSLVGGVPMPEGPGRILKMTPWKSYGTPETVATLDRVLRRWDELYSDRHPVLVGNMSAREGGRLKPHSSHQSGRDVDLSYPQKLPQGEELNWREMNARNLDAHATWDLLKLLAQTEKLEVALVDTSIQKLLHAHAQEHGCIPKRELRQWLEYPRKPGTTRAMVQHHAGHVDHLHARFRCEEDDKRCKRR